MSVNNITAQEERPPYIQFETRAIENKRESIAQGHYVGTDVDYVFVTLPGGRDVYASKVEPWIQKQETYAKNGRIKAEWLEIYKNAYTRWKKGEEIPVNGTPIKGWGALSPVQEKMILSSGIRTIEDLAGCNDEGLSRLGMGGRDLVNKANSWLRSVNDHGKVAMQNAALEKANENLQTTVESLEKKVEILSKMVESQNKQTPQVDVSRETISASDILDNEQQISSDLSIAEQYEAKFGKKPHWKMKESTIRAKLEE